MMLVRAWSLLVLYFCVGCGQQIPPEAKDALTALKKLEAKTEVGINLIDYGHALGDAKYSVKTFLEHPEAERFPDLSAAIKRSMRLYEAIAQKRRGYSCSFSALDFCYSAPALVFLSPD